MVAYNAEGSPVKALLVDQCIIHTRIITALLRILHCDTTVAKNGKEALDLFVEGKKFDIVFLDKKMPIMSGLMAVVEIRAMGENDVKIVGMSYDDDDAMEAFMNAGADMFLPKPVHLDTLRPMIQEVINKKNAIV